MKKITKSKKIDANYTKSLNAHKRLNFQAFRKYFKTGKTKDNVKHTYHNAVILRMENQNRKLTKDEKKSLYQTIYNEKMKLSK